MIRLTNLYKEKHQYLIGLGIGATLASLFLVPDNATHWSHKNAEWLIFGLTGLVLGVAGAILNRINLIKNDRQSNIKELLDK